MQGYCSLVCLYCAIGHSSQCGKILHRCDKVASFTDAFHCDSQSEMNCQRDLITRLLIQILVPGNAAQNRN